ncbi:tripartite tricarboxylate transporter TctB family protein [Vibrio caribbeanicus]|uniref:Tricarboxylic transport TctB n=1 Tax=Vibrio caribbeanicus ATCC BAA-2122 TaxID=796620 RepID=E3BH30_9VIBR|nr:tripartite tricarboxylate transporter TctB family protein [Vibrio caribbeanicus]EFP97667.1 tricarboxylic transport TctB [Vibrio caribbeanicus ATCC BAA-2122]
MSISRDHIGGSIFLVLSVTYGYYAQRIPMLPGDEFEPFHAQTLPIALSYLGGILGIAMLATAKGSVGKSFDVVGLDFLLVAKLLANIVLFALALEWIGFTLATILFLMIGYWLLGEREIKTLILASVPFAIGIWVVLVKLLDIYLAPGRLLSGFGS